ncbi:uncharacterized protein LOC119043500 [Artibeus jamaicensis]|uniref:uncharacterized protein LOC119043500 n=1 Tax=Artibeus jamaicensis TaxID=9417 RepID=UPI00235A8D0C|nr:uncharacterized protein LOC119043500 [Artibeus jamaicensis]
MWPKGWSLGRSETPNALRRPTRGRGARPESQTGSTDSRLPVLGCLRPQHLFEEWEFLPCCLLDPCQGWNCHLIALELRKLHLALHCPPSRLISRAKRLGKPTVVPACSPLSLRGVFTSLALTMHQKVRQPSNLVQTPAPRGVSHEWSLGVSSLEGSGLTLIQWPPGGWGQRSGQGQRPPYTGTPLAARVSWENWAVPWAPATSFHSPKIRRGTWLV